MGNNPLIFWTKSQQELPAWLITLCDKYSVSKHSSTDIPIGDYFCLREQRVVYVQGESRQELCFDFEKPFYKILHQKKKHALGPFTKALGKSTQTIVDMTCGSAGDSLFMLALGLKVYAFERNPIIAFLLEDAKRFYLEGGDELALALQNFDFQYGSALQNSELLKSVDAIYYDPMYPVKKKSSALARKEIEMFKKIAGTDEDKESVLQQVFQIKGPRIIVKRPLREGPLLMKPTGSFSGKTTRYDLYKF